VPYRPLEHTADVGFEVTAPTLAELYAEAVPAFTASFTDVSRVDERLEREITVAAPDREALLVDWLGELLAAFAVDGLLLRSARVRLAETASGLELAATARGEPYDPARHPLAVEVKAVTYHGLAVEETGTGFRACVILDI
jgi:SHS2 domain-containing protein